LLLKLERAVNDDMQNNKMCKHIMLSYQGNTQVDESDTGPDRIWSDPTIRRNLGCETTNGSDGKIIITPHLIIIHSISTMGCNFTQLFDPIGSDCRILSDSNTMDPLVIPQPGSYEFHQIPTELPSDPIRSDCRI
jgi:hypothetical protein